MSTQIGQLKSNFDFIAWENLKVYLNAAAVGLRNPQGWPLEQVSVSGQDRLAALRWFFFDRLAEHEHKYFGFILRDCSERKQTLQLKNELIPLLNKAELHLKLVHESPYFCNRGYYHGNLLKFYVFEVIENGK